MSHGYDPHKAAIKHVLESDDPVAELLELARLETRCRQVRRRVRVGSVAALLLVGVGAFLLAVLDARAPAESEGHTAIENARWVLGLGPKARHGPLSQDDEVRVRSYLQSDSALLRRTAVVTLSTYGLQIDPSVLEEVAFELAETIDHPVVVAARDGAYAADALFSNHQATLRAVAAAIWIQCSRTHSYPNVPTIERLLAYPDSEVRKSCCKALGQLHDYVLTPDLRARIEADAPEVRRAARHLLNSGK